MSTDLLATAVAAHGGLDRWHRIRTITVDASITGAFWQIKGKDGALADIRFDIDTTRERLTMDFHGQDRRTVFEPDRVVLQRRDGTVLAERDEPERAFAGHGFETPWDDLHLAYFTGAALWTYLTIPFLFTQPGFVTEEITPIDVDGEKWRRLEVVFPDHIKSHTRRQVCCFGPDGLLRRHDFRIDVVGGAVESQLHATDYRTVEDIVIPATRRAYATDGDHRFVLVGIGMTEIAVH